MDNNTSIKAGLRSVCWAIWGNKFMKGSKTRKQKLYSKRIDY